MFASAAVYTDVSKLPVSRSATVASYALRKEVWESLSGLSTDS